jgi:phage tail protein X
MPATTYKTRTGDMLDLICYRHYDGRQSGAVEAVLEANRHLRLAELGPILPPGLTLMLPELTEPIAQTQKLWD